MNDNIQFEYVTERKVWDYETHRYIDRPEKTFLEVLDTYPHHYTGDPMCRIRQHYVDDSGHPYVDEKVVMQSIVLKLWEENRDRFDSETKVKLTEKAREGDYAYLGSVADAMDICGGRDA